MKIITFSIMVVSLSILTPCAHSEGFISPEGEQFTSGGFNGPVPSLTTVQHAKSLFDDSWVILEGNVIRRVGHELYEFRDNSGAIYVDIDDRYWMGKNITEKNKIHIEGEVDRDWDSVEVDVKTLRIIE